MIQLSDLVGLERPDLAELLLPLLGLLGSQPLQPFLLNLGELLALPHHGPGPGQQGGHLRNILEGVPRNAAQRVASAKDAFGQGFSFTMAFACKVRSNQK